MRPLLCFFCFVLYLYIYIYILKPSISKRIYQIMPNNLRKNPFIVCDMKLHLYFLVVYNERLTRLSKFFGFWFVFFFFVKPLFMILFDCLCRQPFLYHHSSLIPRRFTYVWYTFYFFFLARNLTPALTTNFPIQSLPTTINWTYCTRSRWKAVQSRCIRAP